MDGGGVIQDEEGVLLGGRIEGEQAVGWLGGRRAGRATEAGMGKRAPFCSLMLTEEGS
jgi:hypothetical protein